MNLHENIAAFKMIYGKGPKPKSGALSLKGEVDSVGSLPMEGNQDGDVYIVGQPSSSDKAEYYWFKGTWNYLGETPIDLSAYATVEYVDEHEVGKKYYVDGVPKGEVFNNAREASGKCSHAEGWQCTSKGAYSHAEGWQCTSKGTHSHAEGGNTQASGNSSHTEGANTQASGDSSHAEGSGTIAASDKQHAQGKYNVEDPSGKYAFIIGNGSPDARSNAFAIDWAGNIYVNNSTTGVNVNDLMPKSSIVKLNSMDEFNALAEKTADWYFIKEG